MSMGPAVASIAKPGAAATAVNISRKWQQRSTALRTSSLRMVVQSILSRCYALCRCADQAAFIRTPGGLQTCLLCK
jgi:hypothetical protein